MRLFISVTVTLELNGQIIKKIARKITRKFIYKFM